LQDRCGTILRGQKRELASAPARSKNDGESLLGTSLGENLRRGRRAPRIMWKRVVSQVALTGTIRTCFKGQLSFETTNPDSALIRNCQDVLQEGILFPDNDASYQGLLGGGPEGNALSKQQRPLLGPVRPCSKGQRRSNLRKNRFAHYVL